MTTEKIEVNESVAIKQWIDRFAHVAGKLGMVLGLNNQERQWVRDAGFNVADEEE